MLTLYVVFAWFIGICYGFVLISSAAGHTTNVFPLGEKSVFQLHSTVLLNENSKSGKNVGFFITGDVIVDCIWGEGDDKLLKIEVRSKILTTLLDGVLQLRAPQLHIRSRKAPSPDGFIQHSSKLEEFGLKPFYITWQSGKINKILIPQEDSKSLSNLKKGIASLFQVLLLSEFS